jgi:hypothetical protein
MFDIRRLNSLSRRVKYTFTSEETRKDIRKIEISPSQSGSSHPHRLFSTAAAVTETQFNRVAVRHHRGHLAALAPFPRWVYDMYDAQVKNVFDYTFPVSAALREVLLIRNRIRWLCN